MSKIWYAILISVVSLTTLMGFSESCCWSCMTSLGPPDGYFIRDPISHAWGMDIDCVKTGTEVSEVAIAFSGAQSIGRPPELETDFIPIEDGVDLYIEARVKANSISTGRNVLLSYELFDVNQVSLGSAVFLNNAIVTTKNTYETIGGGVPSLANQRFVRIYFGKTILNFTATFDSVELKRAITGVSLQRVVGTQVIAANTQTTVIFDTDAGQLGQLSSSRMSANLGTGVITVLRPGFYNISAGVTVQANPNQASTLVSVRLSNGAGAIIRQGAAHTFDSTGGAYTVTAMVSGALFLTRNSTIAIEVFTDHVSIVQNGGGETWIDVHRVDTI